MASSFLIMEQVAPEPDPRNRYRIVELIQTCDGFRSRLTNISFGSLAEAQVFVREHEADASSRNTRR